MNNVQTPTARTRTRTQAQTHSEPVSSQSSVKSFAIGILIVIVAYQTYILFVTRNMSNAIAVQTTTNAQNIEQITNDLSQALRANQEDQQQK